MVVQGGRNGKWGHLAAQSNGFSQTSHNSQLAHYYYYQTWSDSPTQSSKSESGILFHNKI